jgi:hypothetical protein
VSDSLAHEPGQSHQAWVFKTGAWKRAEDPVFNQSEEDEVTKMIKAAGYSQWTGVGTLYATPLILTVWSRPAEPCYLFDLEGADRSEWFYAATLPDALTLLNELAPTLQALTITDQIAQAEPKSMSVLADVLDKVHDRRRDKNGHLVSD